MWKKNFSTRDDRYIKAGFTSQQSNRSKYQNVICAKQSSKLLRWVKQSQRLYCSSTCDVSRTTSQRGKFLDFLLPRRKFSISRWAAITVRLEESSECIRNDQQIINRQKRRRRSRRTLERRVPWLARRSIPRHLLHSRRVQQLSPWFPAPHWRTHKPLDAFNIDQGNTETFRQY